MIGATEPLDAASVRRHHQRSSMAASVVQYRDTALVVANDNKRTTRDRSPQEATRLSELAFMPDVAPCASENTLEFELEHRGIGIHTTMYARRLHQIANLGIRQAMRDSHFHAHLS
jgi:hypothetical protein